MKQTVKTTVPVFFAVDDNYVPQLAVALRSLIANRSEKYNYEIYVLIEALSDASRNAILAMQENNVRISFVDVAKQLYSICSDLHVRDYYTNTTYYRFFIPELFPQYEKGIYLDCDIVITCDIAKMYQKQLGNKLAGVITDEVISDIDVFAHYSEIVLGISRYDYFNAGIMLMNLGRMREEHLRECFVDLLSKKTYTVAQDQDYLNVLCHNKVRHLSLMWNKTPMPDSNVARTPKIVHYKINFKPWRYDNIPYGELFWQYARMTPYFEYFQNTKNNYSDEEKARDEKQYLALEAQARYETKKKLAPKNVIKAIDSISLDIFDDAAANGKIVEAT